MKKKIFSIYLFASLFMLTALYGENVQAEGISKAGTVQQVAQNQSGWVKDYGLWFYYENGMKKTGWLEDGYNTYYLDGTSGAMKTGWFFDGYSWYYFEPSGVLKTGWLFNGGSWYYLDQELGFMHTGEVHDGYNLYYLDMKSGAMKTGWVHDGAGWMYFNANGTGHTGWLKDGGVWYYLHPDYYYMVTSWWPIDGK
ncbi:hypothetical protein AB1283_17380 [Bacillus sp. S13(2024)]|uniref:hypothetical protein n=1 Tax=unclassified Bacillus (in: firmicutes) TaxID=185979 RepID=UPI003D24E55F